MGLRDRFKKVFGQGKKEDEKSVRENESSDESVFKDSETVGEVELPSDGKVLFVCSGNTDRSPMAEAIFNQKSSGQKAFSAGLFAQNGDEASHNAVDVCANHGINLSGHKTRYILDFPVEDMDLVLAVTVPIRDALKMQYPNSRIFTIKECAGGYSDLDIMDPFGGDLSSYEECFSEIYGAVLKILDNEIDVVDKSAVKFTVKNFTQLDELIHSGVKEIVLESDITLEDEEINRYLKGIDLDVPGLVIDGCGHSIDGCGEVRIFKCSASTVLKNITLKNGSAIEGGAIYSCNTLTLYNTTFKGNCATFDKGGAIHNRSHLHIVNSRFIKNEILNGKYSTAMSGGAIWSEGNVDIANTIFEQNCSNYGGAISCKSTQINIESSTFRNNEAYGGVIYNRESDIDIKDSTFESNKCGTVINGTSRVTADLESEMFMANLNMTGVKILNNYNHINSGVAIEWYSGGKVNMERCTFTRDKEIPPENMHNYILKFADKVNVNIIDTTFENCSEDYGAISASKSEMYISDCRFLHNSCPSMVKSYGGNLIITNVSFIENACETVVGIENESSFNMTHSEFIANAIEGPIIHNDARNAYIEKTKFKDNVSLDTKLRDIHNEAELSVRNLKIEDNGKTILNEGTLLVKGECEEISDKIENYGKVYGNERSQSNPDFTTLDEMIHEGGKTEIVLSEDITLEKYERDFFEGGIELDIDGLVIDGAGKTIDANGNSRIFYVTGKDITLKNITFKRGNVYKDTVTTDKWQINDNGGAIRCIADTCINIINCRFEKNSVDGEGGAIYSRRGNVTIEDSCLVGNNAHSGGAISTEKRDVLKIRNCQVRNNHAKDSGGAIQCFSFEIHSSCFKSNSSRNGGAIYVYGKDSKVKIDDTTFLENRASRDGGTLHIQSDYSRKLEISNSKFIKNRCEQYDAVIYPNRLESNLENCMLEGNHASEIDFF